MQQKIKTTKRPNEYIPWLILATFYLYQYIPRSSPCVLINEIRHNFHINADEFALMGSMFYYGYGLMQIPLGVIVDRVGIRRTILASILVCILTNIAFGLTDIPLVGYLSRFVFGLGAASAFMCSLKFVHDYLPKHMQGLLIGATLTFGVTGALITGFPLNYLLKQIPDWRSAFFLIAAVGLILWLFSYRYLPKIRKEPSEPFLTSILPNLISIIKTKSVLVYACIAIALFLPLTVMADLWGSAFLMRKYGFSREVASPLLMNIYIGMAFGSITLPYLAGKFNILNKLIQLSIVSLFILFAALVYVPDFSQLSLTILLISIGFFCGAEMLCFAAVLKHTNSKTSGLTIGVVNTLNMLSSAILQHTVGIYLELTWSGELGSNGLKVYSVKEFIEAFSILVIIIGICATVACLSLNKKKTI